MSDYPQGDGKVDCPHCHGRGVIPIPAEEQTGITGGQTRICTCVVVRDVKANVERGWKGLGDARPIPESPLWGRDKECLRITSPDVALKEHLRHVAIRMGPRWYFAVVSDTDLMDAWLSGANEVVDPDVDVSRRRRPSNRFGSLADLTEPPELLIIIVGVKVARNAAMPEVLLEAITHRLHLDKPTWVVDHPLKRLNHEHISWDSHVENTLCLWPAIELEGSTLPEGVEPAFPTAGTTGVAPTMSQGFKDESATSMLDQTVTENPKKGGKR